MDLWNDFEEFTQGASSSRGNAPRISLNNRGDITLNQMAYEHLKGADKVVLGFSKPKGLIGIRPAKEDETHSFKVKQLAKSSSYVIRGKVFCRHYGIIPPQTVVFDDFKADEVGIILDLNKVTIVAPRTRRSKPKEEPKEEPKEQENSLGFSWLKKTSNNF